MPKVEMQPGEIIVDSQRAAEVVHSQRRLWQALEAIRTLHDTAAEVSAAADAAQRALDQEPAYNAIPAFVEVDCSWADELPKCIECGQDVQWLDAVLMPCSTIEDGDVDTLGIIHRAGCPAAGASGGNR